MPTTVLALVPLVLCAPSGLAQGAPVLRSFEGRIGSVVADPVTGVVRAPGPAPASGTQVADAYDNAICASGFWASPAPGEAWLDFGVKATGYSGVVSALSVGYVTTALDPGAGGAGAAFGFDVHAGATGFGDPGTLLASYDFTALPGSSDGVTPTAYLLEVDLSQAAICLPDGPIGWSHVETGDAGVTGPLLVQVGGCASGTVDAIDRYVAPADPTGYLATFAFAQAGIASFSFALDEDDGSIPASAVLRNTTNPVDYVVTQPPVVCGTFDAVVAVDPAGLPVSVIVFGLPDLVGSSNPFGGGDLLVQMLPPPLVHTGSGTHSVPIPPDVSAIGQAISSQGFRSGPSGAIDALNAQDLVVGT